MLKRLKNKMQEIFPFPGTFHCNVTKNFRIILVVLPIEFSSYFFWDSLHEVVQQLNLVIGEIYSIKVTLSFPRRAGSSTFLEIQKLFMIWSSACVEKEKVSFPVCKVIQLGGSLIWSTYQNLGFKWIHVFMERFSGRQSTCHYYSKVIWYSASMSLSQ